jgi:hypothetical protein
MSVNYKLTESRYLKQCMQIYTLPLPSDFSSLLVLTKPVLPEEEKSCSKINLLLMLMLSVK